MKRVLRMQAIVSTGVIACTVLSAQDQPVLSANDAPPNGIWVDSLDLGNAAIR